MHRRSILATLFAATGGLFAAAASSAQANPAHPDKQKVAYHLSDLDKVGFVLGNIRNHIEGVGGPENVTIALVVHGPALKAFNAASANAELAKAGVAFAACGKTMTAQNVALKDLLPGFVSLEQGGVVRLAELQSQGYVYLRP